MSINFVTLKWGKKYGPEYVNRLYNGIKANYKNKFKFFCITDQVSGINCHTLSFDYCGVTRQKCFTAEKILLFKNLNKILLGRFVLLDLDVLIMNDLTEYLDQYNFNEPRFIKNYWQNILHAEQFSTNARNYVNSSFVTWKDDQLDWAFDHYISNKELIEFKYGDLDFYLFQVLRHKLNYHPEGIVNTFMEADNIDDYKMILFNTSHGRGVELHEATGYARDRWRSYS
jgi:hypothetical protein